MTPEAPSAGMGSGPHFFVLALLGGAAVLAFTALRVAALLERTHPRWRRPLGIVMGGMLGIALGLPVAALLNPLVGLERGTFHNLVIISICLGFLGFCVGSLGGLVYAGMILPSPPRNEEESSCGRTPEPDFQSVLAERSGARDDA